MAASRAPTPTAAAAADGGIEENAMAILDSFGIKDSRDLHDDRNLLSFSLIDFAP
jgi:hypothetical protein